MREKILQFLRENNINARSAFEAIAEEIPLWSLQNAVENATCSRLSNCKTVEDALKIGFNNYHIYFGDTSGDYLEGYEIGTFTDIILEQEIEETDGSNIYLDSDGYECLNVYLKISKFDLLKKEFEALGWGLAHTECGVILENWSPAGEHLVFENFTTKGLIEELSYCFSNFDVDAHVEMWLPERGKRGVPYSIEDLVEDAKAIDKMYEKLQELADIYLELCV